MTTSPVWAPYCGPAPLPGEWLARWNFDPVLISILAGISLLGWTLISRRPSTITSGMQRTFLVGAIVVLIVLFVSPFCALASSLFSVRVVHHVALAAVVAPLLAAAWPNREPVSPSLPLWTAAQAIVFWAWHAPPLYALALSNDGIYWLMQTSLLGTAAGFWISVRRAGVLTAACALLATMVQMGLLGALLTFSGAPIYAPHLASTLAWGMTPLEDQQLAGLIMWAPAAGFYLAAALLLGGRWFRDQARAAAA